MIPGHTLSEPPYRRVRTDYTEQLHRVTNHGEQHRVTSHGEARPWISKRVTRKGKLSWATSSQPPQLRPTLTRK
jgi:hypothetical protein